jgi:hypothetical protein
VSSMLSTKNRSKQDAALFSGGVAGAVALALCCGGALLAIAFGFAALAAFLVNPWFLLPIVGAAATVAYWRATRRGAACDVLPSEEDQR